MKTNKTYAEKLKDPRWQKRRLQTLERDDWKCAVCQSGDKTLHVHHMAYTKEPWDAKEYELITLCEVHHEMMHKLIKISTCSDELSFVIDVWKSWHNTATRIMIAESKKPSIDNELFAPAHECEQELPF